LVGWNIFGAGFYQASSALSQLLIVPCFMYFWGGDRYGQWLFSVAPLMLLSYADFGSLSVISNLLNRYHGRFLSVTSKLYLSGLVIYAIQFLLVFIVLSLVLWWLYWESSAYALFGFYWLFFSLTIYTANSMRSAKSYPSYLFICATSKVVELLVVLGCLILGGDELAVSISYAIVSAISFFIIIYKRAKSEKVKMGTEVSSFIGLYKKLYKKSISAFLYPFSTALWLQGSIVILGLMFSGMEVALFSTLRTLSRVSVQWTNVINTSYWGEVAKLLKSGNRKNLDEVCNKAFLFSLMGGGIYLLGCLIVGESFYHIWTGISLTSDGLLMASLLLVSALFSFMWLSLALPFDVGNMHRQFSLVYFLLVVAFSGGLSLAGEYGIYWYLLLYIVLDVTMFVYLKVKVVGYLSGGETD